MTSFGPLVSTEWLAEHLQDDNLKIIDGSWRMPGQTPAIKDYAQRHIPGAVFFDIDAIADQTSPLPHMLPSKAEFEHAVGALGVSDTDRIVVYDDQGLFSAARVWWTFRAMGDRNIAVLDGGLPKWTAEDRPLTAEATALPATAYKASPVPALCKSADAVRAALADNSAQVIDARPAPRFAGKAPEPRHGLRSGAMPGALNTPHATLLNEDGTMRSPDALKAIFTATGADLSRPIITSCGSGVTAAVLSLALEIIGHNTHGLYDGSWAEWGDARHDSKEFPVSPGGEIAKAY